MRPLIDLAFHLRRRLLALLRWRTRGVKVMAFDAAGRLLLVRHRYGRSDLWMLPGGGIKLGEPPVAAALRELTEETGCTMTAVAAVGVYRSEAEGRRDTVHLFRGSTCVLPTADGVELEEARFFGLAALPSNVSPATMRRIEEVVGHREQNGLW